MKIEFLAEGSKDCPLIRLYEFDQDAVLRLRELVACRGANITRLRIWSPKRYLLNQLHSSINSLAVPHLQ